MPTSILAFLFVLGVLIFVHELGHYLMAKRLGVRVITFSLGFGYKILKFTRGDTEYCISVIPLGGYVKMAGENPDDPRSGRDDEFLSKTKWQRFLILIMGPVMNLLLAVIVLAGVLYVGAEVPAYETQPPVIGTVLKDSPAAAAGIQPGDRILTVSGRPVETWEELFMAILPRAGRELPVELSRNDQRMTVRVTPAPQSKFEIGDIGVLPEMRYYIRSVTPGDPAARAGIVVADVILEVNGEPVGPRVRPLVPIINQSAGVPLTLSIQRGEQRMTVTVMPEKRGDVGIIGIGLSDYELRRMEPGLLQSVSMSVTKNIEGSVLIFRTLWGLFTRETSPKQLMGPVAIAQLSGDAAQIGWVALFSLMATISLNLGLLNLMPIPVLDGGHIFIMLLEGISRRDFSMRVKEKIMLAGFVALMALMVTVIYNDLTRISWIQNLMPWR